MSLSLYYESYPCEGSPSAPSLVLLHGWGMHSGVWDPLLPALREHFSIHVIDLPGMGRSPVANVDYDLDYLVAQVLDVAPERAAWLGWSLGGQVATALAARYPERVTHLITLASSPRFTATEGWQCALNPTALAQFTAWLEEDWEGTLIRFLALQCKDSATQRDDIRVFKDRVFIHGFPAQRALQGGLRILAHADVREELQGVTCPTLHILGANDPLIPASLGDKLTELQPTAQVACLPGRSHALFVSEPDPIARLIKDTVYAQ